MNGKALSADITLTPKDIGTLNSTTMSFSGGAGWFKLATVTMPQASSVVSITLIGGAGFNVGSPQQAGISELVLRAGNGNPKGIIAPPDIPAGFVAVFNSDESSWHLVEDHRGKTVYDVASGDALFISELGSLPENVTWLSPEGEFQKWNGTAWVKDTEAEKLFRIREVEETKNSLMQVASEHIAPLQDAADLEIATEEEISLLEAWKKYRVLLNRVDTSTAQDIEWPVAPIG